jgi:tRNA-Thr(GGU) m(6)t(6)A37 methyltransferase TsaA
MNSTINFDFIGTVYSPYKEKFAIPRQPGLVTAAQGLIELHGEANNIELVRGLEQFSHIWVLFVFHGTQAQGWKSLVRPPRLGGNKKLGVLATRSTFRPNPIGMSVVKLEDIICVDNKVNIHISALDLMDGTPVVDIKPYIPYSDNIIGAEAGYAITAPLKQLEIIFNKKSKVSITIFTVQHPQLEDFIRQVLMQDPRPAYKQGHLDDKIYGMQLYQLNIKWRMLNDLAIEVIDITKR